MRIGQPLLKLPIQFDGDVLAREAADLPAEAWLAHPQGFEANAAVPLVNPYGEMRDAFVGPMSPTRYLEHCPYVMDVMRTLDSTWGRSRLMALGPGANVPPHVDMHYYWRTHLRIHIPVITNPGVLFHGGDDIVHMEPGECWLLDSFFRHTVENRGDEIRVHLVLDTVGSARLWDLIDRALNGESREEFVAPGSVEPRPIGFEQVNAPKVMTPWEISAHIAYLFTWISDETRIPAARRILDRFEMAWSGIWARYGEAEEGHPHYRQLLESVSEEMREECKAPIVLRNGRGLLEGLRQYVFKNAVRAEDGGLRRPFGGGAARIGAMA